MNDTLVYILVLILFFDISHPALSVASEVFAVKEKSKCYKIFSLVAMVIRGETIFFPNDNLSKKNIAITAGVNSAHSFYCMSSTLLSIPH